MAVSTSFFLAYTATYIKAKKLENDRITIRCELRYTLDNLPWSLSRRVGGKERRVKFNLPIKAIPKYWQMGRARHTHPGAHQINSLIDDISARARSLHAEYVKARSFPDEQDFILEILGAPDSTEKTSFYADYTNYIEFLQNRKTSLGFIRGQDLVHRTLQKFQRATGYRIDYPTINKTFAAKFTAWCENNLPRRRPNQDLNRTARKYLDDLKIFLSHALSEGWTKETVFKQIKISFARNPFPTTLTPYEINRLMALTVHEIAALRPPGRYKDTQFAANAIISRDWFVFAAQTGIRHSDWQAQRFQIISLGPGGMNIRFIQEKTENPLEVPLSNLALQILQKYDGTLPPNFSTAATNTHLEVCCRLAGIDKHITTHTARRTFCTLQEKAGVPRSIIMRISGHRTEKDYLRYIGITFEYNADALRSANPQWFELKKKA